MVPLQNINNIRNEMAKEYLRALNQCPYENYKCDGFNDTIIMINNWNTSLWKTLIRWNCKIFVNDKVIKHKNYHQYNMDLLYMSPCSKSPYEKYKYFQFN